MLCKRKATLQHLNTYSFHLLLSRADPLEGAVFEELVDLRLNQAGGRFCPVLAEDVKRNKLLQILAGPWTGGNRYRFSRKTVCRSCHNIAVIMGKLL